MLWGFGHGLRGVRRVTWNAAGRETDNDGQCYDESWYKAHHQDPPVLSITFLNDASRLLGQPDVLKRAHGTLLP